jgi:hypothetical protein
MFRATDIIKTQGDEGYLLAGTHVRDLGSSWAYLLKLDSTGNIEWQKKYFDRVNVNITRGRGGRVVQVADGGYVLSFGGSGIGGPFMQRIVYKIDSSGVIQWQKKITHPTNGSAATDGGSESRILATDDRGCIVLANYGGKVIIKFDIDTGELLWMKSINSTNQLSINSDLNGGLIVSHFNLRYPRDYNLENFDQNGDLVWAKNIAVSDPIRRMFQVVYVDGEVKTGYISNNWLPTLINIDDEFVTNECVTISSVISPVSDNQLIIVDSNFVTAEYLKDYWGTKESFSVTSLDEPSSIISSDLVSEETICATNESPVAHAGNDVNIECASSIGTVVTLDGSTSFDNDGDTLSYTWAGPFGTVIGPNQTVTLPLGVHTINLKVEDGNGGTGFDQVVITVADTMPPLTSAIISGTAGNNNWYVSPVTIDLFATDICSGITSVSYSGNGALRNFSGKSTSIDLGEGINDISFYATDDAGNVENIKQLNVNIDLSSPIISINGITADAIYPECKIPTPSYDSVDSLSGLANSSGNTVMLSDTGIVSYSYNVTAIDIAGNENNAEVTYEVVEGIQGLIELVRRYVASGQIATQMEVSLIAQLKKPCKLNAFYNHVQAQYGKKIASQAADMLINSAICLCQ